MLASGIEAVLDEKKIPYVLNRVGSMLSIFFHSGPVFSYEEALQSDREVFSKFFGRMLEQGIYLAPSPFESWFLSTAHTSAEIEKTITAASLSL